MAVYCWRRQVAARRRRRSGRVARAAVEDGLALDPYFTRRRFHANPLSDHPTFLAAEERISQGMRMAGVPEG